MFVKWNHKLVFNKQNICLLLFKSFFKHFSPASNLIRLAKLLLIYFAFLSSTKAQEVNINSRTATWYGLDFSKVKLIGSEGFSNAEEIKKLFSDWNQQIIVNPKVFNIKKTFNKREIINELSVVEKRNMEIKASELIINEDYKFDSGIVQSIINSYNPPQNSGLGIVFIVESLNKIKEEGTIHITFFNIATKQIILTERIKGKPEGLGLNEYWEKFLSGVFKNAESKMEAWTKMDKNN